MFKYANEALSNEVCTDLQTFLQQKCLHFYIFFTIFTFLNWMKPFVDIKYIIHTVYIYIYKTIFKGVKFCKKSIYEQILQ